MGIAEQVLEEYEARNEFQDVAEYLVKDGSMCGYLFRCLHCEQYHLGLMRIRGCSKSNRVMN